jgi:hypothetical protein
MHRSVSSAIWVYMKKGQMNRIEFLTKPENRDFPIAKAKEEDMILKNFIWKPKDRPRSKQDIINPPKPEPAAPKTGDKKSQGKAPGGKPGAVVPSGSKPAVKDTTTAAAKPLDKTKVPAVKKDSTNKADTLKKLPVVKPQPAAKKDTAVKATNSSIKKP